MPTRCFCGWYLINEKTSSRVKNLDCKFIKSDGSQIATCLQVISFLKCSQHGLIRLASKFIMQELGVSIEVCTMLNLTLSPQ